VRNGRGDLGNPIDLHRRGEILEALLSEILEGQPELASDFLANLAGDEDLPGSATASSLAAILTPSP